MVGVKAPGKRRPAGAGVMSVAEVAAACRVGVTTVKKWVQGGRMPSYTLPSGTRRFRVAEVRRFLEANGLDRDILDGMVTQAVGSETVYLYGVRAADVDGWRGPVEAFVGPLDLAAAIALRMPRAVVVGPRVTETDAGLIAGWVRGRPGGTLTCLVAAVGEYACRTHVGYSHFDHLIDFPHRSESVVTAVLAGRVDPPPERKRRKAK